MNRKGSIECMIVGEQAKKLRETVGLSYEDMLAIEDLTVTDLQNFENGELYSIEVIQNLYRMYLQAIEMYCLKNRIPFLEFLESFCKDNELDFDSMFDAYAETTVTPIVNCTDKELVKSMVSSLVKNSKMSMDNSMTAFQGMKAKNEMIEKLSGAVDDLIDRNNTNKSEANIYFAKYHILLDAISTWSEGDGNPVNVLSEKVTRAVESWKEAMTEEDTGETCDHETWEYEQVINDLKTYWKFDDEIEEKINENFLEE